MNLGPALRAKSIDIVFLVDVSGSMAGDAKIQSLNAALEESLPFLRQEAADSVGVEPRVRVLTFGSHATWVVERQPLADFWWQTVEAEPGGLTELGSAIELVLDVLDTERHELAPALVLLTDGMPTDTVLPSFTESLERLDEHRVGRATQRVAIAIGQDADDATLSAFVARAGGRVMNARRPDQLTEVLRIAGTTMLRTASEPTW